MSGSRAGGEREVDSLTNDPFDMQMDAAALIGELVAAADPVRAVAMKKYMRDNFEFLGVGSPERRAIVKPYFVEARKDPGIDWGFVAQCWALPQREFQYAACDYLFVVRSKLGVEDAERLRVLAGSKPWWDSVDSLHRTVGYLVSKNSDLRAVMVNWASDESFWVRRLAIEHQLSLKGRTDVALLAQIVQLNLGSDEFFINKAIGWALREYSKTNQAWVRDFIETHRADLAPLSIREGSKYL